MLYKKEGSGNWMLGLVVFIVLALGGAVYYFAKDTPEVETLGSTPIGGEFQSTTTRSTTGDAMPNYFVIKNGSGTLGSVVITGAGTGVMNFFDATSTVNNTAWATTTLASFPASTAAGTYTFDAIVRKGILVQIVGSVATATVTFR